MQMTTDQLGALYNYSWYLNNREQEQYEVADIDTLIDRCRERCFEVDADLSIVEG
jgi:hypothetical protein